MSRNEIKIKENVLEAFLVKILQFYSNNFEKVESYLFKAESRLSPKIIESLLNEYHKVMTLFKLERGYILDLQFG